MLLICDTGPIVAAANIRDEYHQESRKLIEEYPGRLIVPSLVVAEVGRLLLTRISAESEADFIDDIVAGNFEVEELTKIDWLRTQRLVHQYIDLKLGVVDAAVVAVAERLRAKEIATVNSRDFRAVIPKHVNAFRMLPLDGFF